MPQLLFLLMLSLQAPQKVNSPRDRVQSAAANQRGSDSLPLSVKLMNTGESEADAKQKAEQVQHERAVAKTNVRLTVVLVAATVLTLGVLVFQSWWLRESVKSTEDHTRIDLRGYLRVSEVSIDPPRVEIRLANVGKTPAHNIVTRFHTYYGPKSMWNPRAKSRPTSGEMTLGPGGSFLITSVLLPLTESEEEEITRGDVAMIYVHGRVTYDDVFGKSWPLEFCYDAEADKLQRGGPVNLTDGYNKAS